MSTQEYLTQEKFNELTTELNTLKTTKRKEIADKLEFARSLGDLSENAEYDKARDDQAQLEDRIAELETLLNNAKIVSVQHSTSVGIGSKVSVRRDGEKTDREFIIVGSEEVDIAQGKISFKSPMASAMLGKGKGDEFTFTTPAGEMKYKISSIE
jgi:transcription elongation factor GreA